MMSQKADHHVCQNVTKYCPIIKIRSLAQSPPKDVDQYMLQ